MADTTKVNELIQANGWNGTDDFHRVWNIINEWGMTPDDLNIGNVDFIKEKMAEGSGQTIDLGNMVDKSILEDKFILKIRSPSHGRDLYFLHAKDPLSTEEAHGDGGFYSFDQLIDMLKDVDVPIAEQVITSRPPKPEPDPNLKGLDDEAVTTTPRTPRQQYEGMIHGALFEYLVERRHEIVEKIFGDTQSEGTKISQNTGLLREVLTPDMYDAIIREGHDPSLLSIIEFMGQTVKRRITRIRKEVKDYLRTEGSSFLADFDYATFKETEHVPQVIKWLAENNEDDVPNDMGFYATVLRSYLTTNAKDAVTKTVLDDWVSHAHDYERMRHHPIGPSLPETGTTETYMVALTKELLKQSEHYQNGDITHLFQGLRSMDRVTDDARSRANLNLQVAAANYLIANIERIDGLMKNVYGRIKEGHLANDNIRSHQFIYAAIQDGTIKDDNFNFFDNQKNLDVFKRSMDKQMTQDEKDSFTRMRSPVPQIVDSTYREDIIRLYLQTKGPELLRG